MVSLAPGVGAAQTGTDQRLAQVLARRRLHAGDDAAGVLAVPNRAQAHRLAVDRRRDQAAGAHRHVALGLAVTAQLRRIDVRQPDVDLDLLAQPDARSYP